MGAGIFLFCFVFRVWVFVFLLNRVGIFVACEGGRFCYRSASLFISAPAVALVFAVLNAASGRGSSMAFFLPLSSHRIRYVSFTKSVTVSKKCNVKSRIVESFIKRFKYLPHHDEAAKTP